jgi:16S rRNA (cytidine1402-2'-O)-methyltransferase
MTYRAVNVLKEVDYILCEDTRTSGILLKHFEISKPLKSYHLHNEHQTTEKVITDLKSGQNIAIITDAGTPESQIRVICWQKQVPIIILK